MRGKTNILPMVGGYINAPVQNETAGEALQLGDLVQRSYSDAPQQIKGTASYSDINCFKPMQLYDGKFVYFRNIQPNSVNVKIALVEKSVNSFVVSEKVIFTTTNYDGMTTCFVPVNDRMFVVFARTGYGNSTYPYVYYCKKVVYDGTDFTVTDLTYDNFPELSYQTSNKFARGWCIGSGGTLFTTTKIYYLTYNSANNSISVYGGTSDAPSPTSVATPKILYLSQQDLFLCFVGYMSGGTVSYFAAKFSNGSLSVTSLSSDIYCPEVFGNYIVGFEYYTSSNTTYYKLLIGTVNNSGAITMLDELQTDIVMTNSTTYQAQVIIPYQDYFVIACQNNNQTYFRVYYYNSGFVEGDKFVMVSTSNLGVYSTFFEKTLKGFIVDGKNGSDGTYGNSVRLFYQEMKGDKFASADSNYTMIKAISKIEGVVKRGGSTGDTIEVFVPQLSS